MATPKVNCLPISKGSYVSSKDRPFLAILRSIRAALTTHKLEPWSKLAELELKCSNRELVDVGNTNVTQGI